ncbi:MAG: adenylate kinase [archaeon]|nr:MAG: adenylate kinase [archaeon]
MPDSSELARPVRLRAVIVGIPGVGKTTIVGALLKMIKGSRVANFGSEMTAEAKRLGWATERDDLRKLPVEKQRRLQKLAAVRISKMREQVVLIDTHVFIRTPEGFWPGIPFDIAVALKPTHIVLLEATPDEVLARRLKDGTRRRDEARKADIEADLALARQFVAITSTVTGAPMLMLRNDSGRSADAAGSVAKVLKEAMSR